MRTTSGLRTACSMFWHWNGTVFLSERTDQDQTRYFRVALHHLFEPYFMTPSRGLSTGIPSNSIYMAVLVNTHIFSLAYRSPQPHLDVPDNQAVITITSPTAGWRCAMWDKLFAYFTA